MLPACCEETGVAAVEPGPAANAGSAWGNRIALGTRFPVRPNVPHSSLSRWLPSIITALTSKMSTGEYTFLKPTLGTRVSLFCLHTAYMVPQRGKQRHYWWPCGSFSTHYSLKKQALQRHTHRYCPHCAYRPSEHLGCNFSSATKHFVLNRLQDTECPEPSTKSHFAPW